jgi:hypothetical protein
MAILIAGGVLASCSSVFFFPHRKEITNPQKLKLAWRDIEFKSADGTALHGWLLLATAAPKGTVVFLHGNAENISTHVKFVSWLPPKGFNVFIADYRGYGRSDGAPEIAGAYADAKRALQVAMEQPETRDGNFVLFGQSLGGALALRLGASVEDRSRVRAVIAESAFSDYRAIAREKLKGFWLTWPFQWPLALFISNGYSPIKTIDRISPTPVLLLHGTTDEIVPVRHSVRLYKAAREPKEIWYYDRGHTRAFADPEMRGRFVTYLEDRLR